MTTESTYTYTKQGVRDLDAKLGRVKSNPVELPPMSCDHKRMKMLDSTHQVCYDCGMSWDHSAQM